MNRSHIERMAEDKGNPFLLTEVCQPIPREDTLDADDHILSIGSKDAQKRFGGRRQIFMNQNRATLVEDANVPRLRM